MNYRDIISIEPGKRGGRPCIRHMRIAVADVLGWLAAGQTHAQILDDFPELTEDDIRACLAYAADRERRLDGPCALGVREGKVTHDADFAELVGLLGSPPKVVWLRTGNQTTATIAALLRRHAQTIQSIEGDDSVACLEIY